MRQETYEPSLQKKENGVSKEWRPSASLPEPFACPCGCKRTVTPTPSIPNIKYFNEGCRNKAQKEQDRKRYAAKRARERQLQK